MRVHLTLYVAGIIKVRISPNQTWEAVLALEMLGVRELCIKVGVRGQGYSPTFHCITVIPVVAFLFTDVT